MAVSAITYADKQPETDPVINQPGVTDKWRAEDSNEVKNTVNNHKTYLDQFDAVIFRDYSQIFMDQINF